jgi:hypothetical protein
MLENIIILATVCLAAVLLVRKVRKAFSGNASSCGCAEDCAGCRGSEITHPCSPPEQKEIDSGRKAL